MSEITQSFSQLLLTYGPGAMLDLPEHAVVVAGLQDWDYKGAELRLVEEERLVALLRQQLGAKLSPNFQGLREPPAHDENQRGSKTPGVGVRIFPCWFLVDDGADDDKNPASGAGGKPLQKGRRKAASSEKDQGAMVVKDPLAPQGSGASPTLEKRRRMVAFNELEFGSGRLSFPGAGKKAPVNPIRFVAACTKGHLQDINWRFFTHRGGDLSCRKPLYWVERGVTSDPSDISVRCDCGASVNMVEFYKSEFMGTCECQSPWLTPRHMGGETCTDDLRLMPRSATNTYFPQTVTVISLTKSNDRLRQTIAENRTSIDSIRALPNFLDVLRAFPQLKEAFKDFSNDEILQALGGENAVAAEAGEDPRVAEFDMMASGASAIGRDGAGSFFYAETLDRTTLELDSPWDSFLQAVVKVHRLREVSCLYGFTRLEPLPTAAESELDEVQLAVNGADLARNVEWLPAIERFGEGIFLHVSPAFLNGWLDQQEVRLKAGELRKREESDATRHGRKARHRGIAYWALHSLSHAFMAELALECGYPLSSLKERVYSSGPGQAGRFGILVYTSSAGGQGTLGGLSNMAERAGEILTRATTRLKLCSNDPICADHSHASEEYPLQGAACHGCLLIPETSCEARNTRLDRALLVRTLSNDGLPLLE